MFPLPRFNRMNVDGNQGVSAPKWTKKQHKGTIKSVHVTRYDRSQFTFILWKRAV